MSSTPSQTIDDPNALRFRLGCLAAQTTLLVSSLLLPGSMMEETGNLFILIMLQLLLAAAWFGRQAWRQQEISIGLAEIVLLALVGWLALSGAVMAESGTPRHVANATWSWLGIATCFVLVRQLVRTSQERCILATLMLGMATAQGVLGIVQWSFWFEQVQQAHVTSPLVNLASHWLDANFDSPATSLFLRRIEVGEPTGTFASSELLASFLVPWMVIAAARKSSGWYHLLQWAVVGLLGSCLILSQNVGAGLAVILGIAVATIKTSSPQKSKFLTLATIGSALLIGVFWSNMESGLSWSTWVAACKTIQQHPLWGSGIGNFLDFYTTYATTAPSASQRAQNMLLEIGASGGLVAIFLFIALLTIFVRQLACQPDPQPSLPENDKTNLWILGGMLLGTGIAFPLGILTACFPGWWMLLCGLPLGLIVILLLRSSWKQDECPPQLMAGALVAGGVQLLLSDGISFLGIANSYGLLVVLATPQLRSEIRLPRGLAWTFAGVGFTLLGICFLRGYAPVMESNRLLHSAWLNEAWLRNQPREHPNAELQYREAAAADQLAFRPWYDLAGMKLGEWRATHDPQDFTEFQKAAQQAIVRRAHHAASRQAVAQAFVEAYRVGEDPDYLNQAMVLLEDAIELAPNNHLPHAQLAWVYREQRDKRAAREAELALQLSEAMVRHPDSRLFPPDQRWFRGMPRVLLEGQTIEHFLQETRNNPAQPASPLGRAGPARLE